MKNLIKHILKEETNSVDPKKIGILKNFIKDYFSNENWFINFDLEIGTWRSVRAKDEIPEIIITLYVSDVGDGIDFSYFMDEIDFLMDMLFPRDDIGMYTAVWVMNVQEI